MKGEYIETFPLGGYGGFTFWKTSIHIPNNYYKINKKTVACSVHCIYLESCITCNEWNWKWESSDRCNRVSPTSRAISKLMTKIINLTVAEKYLFEFWKIVL